MGFCSEISYCNKREQLLGSALMKVINILKTLLMTNGGPEGAIGGTVATVGRALAVSTVTKQRTAGLHRWRHRRRCKHWASAAGCYRGDQCQYLHSEDNHQVKILGTLEQDNYSKKIVTTIKDLEAKIEKLEVESEVGRETKYN